MSLAYLQLACAALGVVIAVGNAKEWVIARPMSMLGAALVSLVYYPAGLYAKCLLNIIVFVLNAYGWYQWMYGGTDETPLRISRAKPRALLYALLACVCGTAVLGNLLHRYSQADLPYWDSLHTAMYLIAQWMLVHKQLESWILWMAADIFYIVVLHYKALYILAGLHVFYTVLAVYGYYAWRRAYYREMGLGDQGDGVRLRDITEL